MNNIQKGDFVKGCEGSPYSITNEKMTRGLVTDAKNGAIEIQVIEHTHDAIGVFWVDPEYFEVIGRAKPFVRDEVLALINRGKSSELIEYDLGGVNLSGADLRGANLGGANLSGANLGGVNLRGADLSGANLGGVNLRGADLSDANLGGANLGGVNLRGADLSDANLGGVNLRGADLRGANLSDANLGGADLRGANLSDANLGGANLSDADLSDANLKRANIEGANIDYSAWPLWCGSLGVKVDKRIACQLAYHLCSVECPDPEFIEMRNSILNFANQFHCVQECSVLQPIPIDIAGVSLWTGEPKY